MESGQRQVQDSGKSWYNRIRDNSAYTRNRRATQLKSVCCFLTTKPPGPFHKWLESAGIDILCEPRARDRECV